MARFIMWILGICALIGGIDRAFGSRLGLGKKFEEGFMLMGPTALSMAGILCLVPLVSAFIGAVVEISGIADADVSILGGILAIDMGGYQLAHELALNPASGNFSGVIVAATLGCTISFTIPIGMGILNPDAQMDFAHGILFGLIALPFSLLVGGIMCGLNLVQTLALSLPVLLISMLVLLGVWKKTALTLRGFRLFAKCISVLAILGLTLAAFEYITGFKHIPLLAPIEDAMAVVASIAVVMLGSLPAAELIKRILKRPMHYLGKVTGMNNASSAGLLIGMVSVLPAIALVNDMDRRGRIVNGAFMVCAASAFAAHLGFTAGVNRMMIVPLLISKLAGGLLGAVIALFATRKCS